MDTDFTQLITFIAIFILVIAMIGIGAWLLKSLLSGGSAAASGILRSREKRLGVVEAASVDGRRKLILIKRDNKEHLIMTGGPVDVLIETGIEASRPINPESEPSEDDRKIILARGEARRASDPYEHDD